MTNGPQKPILENSFSLVLISISILIRLFLKDHEFVTIKNKTSGKIFAIDPTLHE
jgi:hypothetical protein